MSERPYVAVIDDDPSVRRALRRLLRAADLDVETYPSGPAFLRDGASRDPDCLVLDVRMPEMSGPQLRRRLRDAGRTTPIVFITAHEEDPAPGPGEPAETTEVVRKPFDDEALLAAVGRAIAGRGHR
jgi:FixJ family two-component response regulator